MGGMLNPIHTLGRLFSGCRPAAANGSGYGSLSPPEDDGPARCSVSVHVVFQENNCCDTASVAPVR